MEVVREMIEEGRSAPADMPRRVGKYRIDHVIGRGAIGIVYKGHDEQIDRPLAIKTLRREILEDLDDRRELLKRFAAEARSAGRCLHPNIVTVFDLVEHDQAPYIVMEYVEAGTLENVIRANRLLPVRQVGEIMAQLLFALDHAHSKGVIHRDIKPANILCPSAASIKVADFGVARLDALNITQPGDLGIIGTPNYMAPERLLGQPADRRADLFSAGVVLYQLLTGAKPFVAIDLAELVRKLTNELPPSVLTFRPELWHELDTVLRKALARDPDERFQTADAFIDALNDSIEVRPGDQQPPLDLTELSATTRREPSGPPSIAESGPERMSRTLSERLSPDAIDALSRSLARSLGPIARLVVKQASRDSTSVDMLLSTLTRQIKTEAEVALFREAAETVLRAEVGLPPKREAVVPQAELAILTEALMPFLGPVARVLAKREAMAAVSRDDLCRRLAAAIPQGRDRDSFVRICATLQSGGSRH